MTHPVDPSVTVVVTENNPDMLRVYWQTPLDPFPSVIGLGSRVVIDGFAHRAGDRIAIASYLGKGDKADRALVRYAAAYADQNDRDYKALRETVASGRLTARYDV